MKLKKIIPSLIFILILLCAFGLNKYISFSNDMKLKKELAQKLEAERIEQERIKKEQDQKYNVCLASDYIDEMENSDVTNQRIIIKQLLNKYLVSVRYLNFENKYNYEYDVNKVYYGARLYKLVEVIYLIEKSNNNELSLDDEVIFLSKYERPNSNGMKNHKYNEKISLKVLLSYVLDSSDNTAHTILVNYIGLKNLQDYGKTLKTDFQMRYDTYGSINIKDLNIYMMKIYELMNLNNDNSNLLKTYMNNNFDNSINTDMVNYYHKYGMYDVYYHDAGISIMDKPYMLLVMSSERKSNYDEIFNNTSNNFYQLNSLLIESQKLYCQNLAYGGNNNG